METPKDNRRADRYQRLHRQVTDLLKALPAADSCHTEKILALMIELEAFQEDLETQNEELRNAQQTLADLHREFEDLYESAPCAYVNLSPKGLITRINSAGMVLLDDSRKPILNSGFSSHVAPEFQDAYFKALSVAGRTGEAWRMVFRLETPPGDPPRWVWAQIQPDREGDGAIIRWRLVLSGIFTKKSAEALQLESELKYRQLFEEMVSGAALFEITERNPGGRPTNFRILEANPAYERITGIPLHRVVGRTIRELFPGMEPVWFDRVDRVIREDEPIQVEGPFQDLDKHLRVSLFRLDDRRFGLTFSDITEHVKVQETLDNRRMELEKMVDERTAELQTAHQVLLENTRELAGRTASLEEVNAALKVLLAEYERQQARLEGNVAANLNELTRPHLQKLSEGRLSARQRGLLEAALGGLDQITSPMNRRLILEGSRLTPTEAQVAGFIRQGRSTKEIAEALGVAVSTVEYHRLNIRKRLRIVNKKVNLQSYLKSLQ